MAVMLTVKMMADRAGLSTAHIAETLHLDEEKVKAVLAPPPPEAAKPQPLAEPLAGAARTMAERGVTMEQIAQMLDVDLEAVKMTVHPGAGADTGTHGEGKVVGNPLQERLDQLLEEEAELCCPVTLVLFVDPVLAGDGFAYERTAVCQLSSSPSMNALNECVPSNATRAPLPRSSFPRWARPVLAPDPGFESWVGGRSQFGRQRSSPTAASSSRR